MARVLNGISETTREMEGNIFADIGEVMIDSVQLKFGCVLACALIDRTEANR